MVHEVVLTAVRVVVAPTVATQEVALAAVGPMEMVREVARAVEVKGAARAVERAAVVTAEVAMMAEAMVAAMVVVGKEGATAAAKVVVEMVG